MNKYVKIRKIGEGAFGKADLVKQKSDGQQYVVKEINIIKMGPKEREDARKEVAVLAQLKHPNIVTYRESFEEHGVLHIVMDYCAGGDLYAKITNQRGILFSEEQILDWFVQMCLAIKHIHDRKILHRDIKSQNIFLTSRGQAQLGDFGIAKVLNSTVELARTCIGTPYYLSPEICENKPYNNKSDIWSLGCVIYEVATLKHAFEAGNMKNLVLKIIRGTYPPMSPKYSYELRGLVSQLFKRTPRDRPSVNTILKKPFISQRVSKFLTDEQVASEFSHTVMHGQKLGRALPPPPKPASRPPSASKRAEPSGAVAASAVKRYDPSKIYGAPVAKKSKENRVSVDVNKKRPGSAGSRPGSAAGSRPSSAAGARPGSSNQARTKVINMRAPANTVQDVQKKRQDLLAKERQRRDDMQKREYERKHKELQEKQKISRIKKSQEEGWKSVLGSLSSEDGSNESKSNQREEPPRGQARWQPPAPAQEQHVVAAGGDASGDGADRGRYEHYHQHLDKMQYERHDANKRAEAAPAPQPAAAYMAAPRPLPVAPKPAPAWRQAPKAPAPTPMYQPYNQRANEQKEERSKLVDDFIQRKREAAMNRQRGNAELFGQSPAYKPLQKQIPANHPYHADQARPSSAQSAQSVRNREEQEYLDRLRQIRYQNYNERRNQGGKHPEQEAEERKKKGDALKRQAEDWAKQRKDALEGKRRDLMEKERRLRDIRQIGEDRPSVPAVSAPAVPMTGAMNAIGAQPKMVPAAPPAKPPPAMTGIVEAIGATPRFVQEEKSEGLEDSRPLTPPKTPIQKQKEEILRKLNQKGPPKGKWGEDKEPVEEPKDSVRPKWGAGGDLKIALEDPESARSKWGQGQVDFGQMSLEETASHMEVTSARDRVIVNPESARRQWGKPGETVLNVLQGVPLAEATIASNKSDDSGTSSASSSANQPIPGVGSTITISKNPIRKGTITIRTAEENKQIDISTANQNLPAPSQTNQNTNLLLPSAKNKEIIPVNVKTDGTANETIDESVTDAKADISPAANQDVSPPSSDVKEPLLSIAEQIEQSFSDIIEKPPIPVKNPPVPAKPEKPLLLPKPVLLPKPDAPMQFGSQRPAPGKSLGAGSLFEKVVLEEQDEDERSGSPESLPRPTSGSPKGSPKPAESPVSGLLRTPSPKSASPKPMSPQKSDHIIVREIDTSSGESDKPKGGLALGITMGTFDMRHTNLLRTCSEPDLTNLFKSLIMETPLAKVKSMDDMTTVDEEDDDAMAAVLSSYERVSTLQDEDDGDTEDKKTVDRGEEEGACEGIETQAGEEEEDVDEDEDDLADLLSVRETMQSLLIDDSEDDNKTSPVKFNISSDQESRGDTNDGDVSEGTEVEHGDQEGNGTVDQEGEGGDEGDDEDGGEESPEGQESGGETGEAEGNWELDEARDIGDGVPRSTSLDNENPQTPDEQRDLLSELFPTDEDSDSEFQDEAYEDFDLFGRLEESRAELEVELGAEKLIRVYKTVQALQEDEDENIEEGARIATDMLGKDKEHLYPKIFQLVMADAAFTDDNLS